MFLKIGHGEDVEHERFEKKQERERQALSLNKTKDDELEEYTISEEHETSVFMLHTVALMKKKILMMLRDKKTLSIDTIFPIILIIAGLALSTVAVIKDGVQREMSPFIFPPDKGSDQYGIYFNGASNFISKPEDIQSFMEDSFMGLNSSAFNSLGTLDITIDPKDNLNIFS